MPPAAHFVSGYVSGYGPLDGRCLPCLGISGRAFNVSPCSFRGDFVSYQQVKAVTLRHTSRRSMPTICNANPNGQRQNSHGFSNNENWHDDDLDSDLEDSEEIFSINGSPALHGSSSPKYAATAAPGPNDWAAVESFTKIKEKIIRDTAIKEGKKVDGSLESMGEVVKDSQSANIPRDGVEALLEVLREHGKNSSSSVSRDFILNQSQQQSSSFVRNRSPTSFDPLKKVKNDVQHKEVPSVSSRTTAFHRRSPVPKPKSDQNLGSFESLTSKRKWSKPDPVSEPAYMPVSEDDLEMEAESDSEGKLEVEDEQVLANGAVFDEMVGDVITSEIEEIGVESDDDLKEKNAMDDNELSGMKIADLKALAKSRGMKGYSKLKKHELIELLGS